MTKLDNAKIYRIVSNVTGDNYYGSTTEPTLARRLAKHRADYVQYQKGNRGYVTSFKIIETNDYEIVLVEKLDNCKSKEELHKRERYYIENNICVNKNKPITSAEEKSKYYETNKSKINERKYEKILCECGSTHVRSLRCVHLQTMKHRDYIKEQKNKIKINQCTLDIMCYLDARMQIPRAYTNFMIVSY